jgi:hypothetical protein
MPARTNSLESAFIAGTLAAVTLLGLNTMASSAPECLENPDLRAIKPGHWHYRSDRSLNRRCWFFVSAEGIVETPESAPPAATLGGDSRQPSQREVLQTQPNAIPDRSGEAPQSISPKSARPNKTVRRDGSQIAPPPATTGAADQRDQPEQSANNEKQGSSLDEANRKALFQDFVKWQLDRNLFGRP